MARVLAKAQRDARADPLAPVDRTARPAQLVFALVLVAALVLFLVLGHDQWFFLDDWDYIATRHAGRIDDLLRPHNEHWSTLPILAYRGLYRLFALRTYVPYQLTSIGLHLTVAVLLWVVMRRGGVRPWIATAAASLFALFGAGSQDIVWAFQMAWSASLALGLIHLLLADHDGPVDRRDWLGLAAGFAGLLCSGVAVTMTIIVGIAVLIRRGWRVALLHTVPLGLVYVVWWVTTARDSYENANAALGQVARFVGTGLEASFDAMGQLPGAGILLGVVLVVGLVLAWRGLDRQQLTRTAAAPGALLAGAFVFLVISGLGRASVWGPAFAREGRYMHVVAALSLPAVAVGADALVRRWRFAGPVVAVLLLVGIPGNVAALADYHAGNHKIPGWVYVRRTIVQSEGRTPRVGCEVIHARIGRTLDEGESLAIEGGPVRLADLNHGGRFLDYTVYDPQDGAMLTARGDPIGLVLAPDDPALPVKVCGVTAPA